jgi:protein-tyrosine kinase
MSRIHEALKQAAQERGSHISDDPVEMASAVANAPIDLPPIGEDGAPSARADLFSQTFIHSPRVPDLSFEELQTHCTHPTWEPDLESNVFLRPAQDAYASEQFRTLRSRLYQLRGSQQLRTLLITSSTSGEGKTFVSNNLAYSIARQPDRRALIIDADLRCPRLHKVLGAPSSPGLSDYLNGTVTDAMSVIQQGPIDRFCMIPAGTTITNPSELLSNGKMRMLLDRLAPVFDWIIVDSPPCLPVADASVLGDVCDGVLLVLRAKSTPAAAIQKACQELQDKNILGVVLNGAKEPESYGSSYYYKNGGE